jgi:hypothetical protein
MGELKEGAVVRFGVVC